MKELSLTPVPHEYKIGQKCPQMAPNVLEDCLFIDGDEVVGFYMRSLPKRARAIAHIADYELRSDNVPKTEMRRSSGLHNQERDVAQYSTIIGSCPRKPQMKREYHTRSSVHGVKTAQVFIKAMRMLCAEAEAIIDEVMPDQGAKQREILQRTPKEWRFGEMFTSSISNYNIPAPFHRDAGNLKGTVNVIITKRRNSRGGNLYIPDYDACVDQCNDSILVYPAWRNMHGVTPIEQTYEGGYRNSLVFYPLKAFEQ